MALMDILLDHDRRKNDVEYEQSLVRLVLGTLLAAYMLLGISTDVWARNISIGFFSASFLILAVVYNYPGDYPIRKIAGQLIDSISVTIYLYFGGEAAAIGYCVYLWVIVGNGCRFGITYMSTCLLITTISFAYIAMNQPFWQQHSSLAIGLWLTQVVVAGYLYGLLKRLNNVNDVLQKLSLHDELTGLLNRRALNEQARHTLTQLKRKHSDFALILVDIDHFKGFNDQHGHVVGDKVLQEVAKLLSKSSREIDLVSRFGGEEFALLSPNANEEDAYQLGENLRSAVEAAKINIGGEEFNVTISVGIACWEIKINQLETWVKKADQALYQAKDQGRNKVIIFDALSTAG